MQFFSLWSVSLELWWTSRVAVKEEGDTSVRMGSDWAGGLKVRRSAEWQKRAVARFFKSKTIKTISNLWCCRASLSLGFGQQWPPSHTRPVCSWAWSRQMRISTFKNRLIWGWRLICRSAGQTFLWPWDAGRDRRDKIEDTRSRNETPPQTYLRSSSCRRSSAEVF